MQITEISYDEAANLLGITRGSLDHAVSRGDLTKIVHQGKMRTLIKEQVMLYVNAGKRTSKYVLSADEYRQWLAYNDAVTHPQQTQQVQQHEQTPIRTRLDDLLDLLKSPSPNQDKQLAGRHL